MVCGIHPDPRFGKIDSLTKLLIGGFTLDNITEDLAHLKDKGMHKIPLDKVRDSYQEVMDMLTKKNVKDSMLMNSLINLRDNCQLPSCAIDYVQHKLREFDSLHYIGKSTELLRNS